jgi:hypothetical protein
MKKILFSLIALMAVMTVQAQSICGTWRTMQPVVNTEEYVSLSFNYTFTFNEDDTFNTVAEMTVSMELEPTKALEIACSMDVSGTYTLDGDQLTCTPNLDTNKVEVLSASMNGVVIEDPSVIKNLESVLNGPSFKVNLFGMTSTVKVTDQMIEVIQNGKTMQLMRLSTIKN